MIQRPFRAAALAAAALASLGSPLAAAPSNGAPAIEGVWRNARDSVRIRTHLCGQAVCATVVQASAKAQADAARGGTPKLIGTQVFREFRAAGRDTWKGKVFVPDMDRTFSGVLRIESPDRLIGKGCILGGLICKSTAWTRVS